MKCISFNVNSVRTRLHQVDAVIQKYAPDFIGIQETKVSDEQFPVEEMSSFGYHFEFFGQKTHYGVALLSKHPFLQCQKGFEGESEDAQRRFIAGQFEVPDYGKLWVLNGYFPQGESRDHAKKFPCKEAFYQDTFKLLEGKHSADDSLILMGDLNIAPDDKDVGIGDANRRRWLANGKCSFLPEEREWFEKLKEWGLVDTYRQHFPDKDDEFSWFDYRSRGFEQDPKRGLRIDFVLATQKLSERCVGAGIDYELRAMEKPSDHCPIWAEFK